MRGERAVSIEKAANADLLNRCISSWPPSELVHRASGITVESQNPLGGSPGVFVTTDIFNNSILFFFFNVAGVTAAGTPSTGGRGNDCKIFEQLSMRVAPARDGRRATGGLSMATPKR